MGDGGDFHHLNDQNQKSEILETILINNSSHELYTSAIQSYFKKPWFYITEIITLMYIFSLTAEQQSGVSAWGARQQ